MDRRLLTAAAQVLSEHGPAGLTVERVAERAGVSRVTAWRLGGSRDGLFGALLVDLATDYRSSMWPIMTAPGTGRDRLERALRVLCDVIDRHLPLVLATDTAFHVDPPGVPAIRYTEPLHRLLLDGQLDGTLVVDDPSEEMAVVLFNAVCWPYAHLRSRHEWPPERARSTLLRLLLPTLNTAS
jgi:AcrR family transcriptional regulator